jgi:hypothetical protein
MSKKGFAHRLSKNLSFFSFHMGSPIGNMVMVSRSMVSPDGTTATTKKVKCVSHEGLLFQSEERTHFLRPGTVVRVTVKPSQESDQLEDQLLWVVEIVAPTKKSGAFLRSPAMRVVRVRTAREIFDGSQMQRLRLKDDDLVLGDTEFYVSVGTITNAETVPAVIQTRDPLGARAFLACHVGDTDIHLRKDTPIDDDDVTMLTSGTCAQLHVDRDQAPFNTYDYILPSTKAARPPVRTTDHRDESSDGRENGAPSKKRTAQHGDQIDDDNVSQSPKKSAAMEAASGQKPISLSSLSISIDPIATQQWRLPLPVPLKRHN